MTRILLLRHGETDSHHGDMPLTEHGRQQAEQAGQALGGWPLGRCLVMTSPLTRARETGLLLAKGIRDVDPSMALAGPVSSWGLRNPDLYLAGERVEMVSSSDAFCSQLSDQLSDIGAAGVESVAFFVGFLSVADRIGYWLHHRDPPGERADQVARRVVAFAASLVDGARPIDTAICVTHSPVQRAVAMSVSESDPGEPDHLAGLAFDMVDGAGGITGAVFIDRPR